MTFNDFLGYTSFNKKKTFLQCWHLKNFFYQIGFKRM